MGGFHELDFNLADLVLHPAQELALIIKKLICVPEYLEFHADKDPIL